MSKKSLFKALIILLKWSAQIVQTTCHKTITAFKANVSVIHTLLALVTMILLFRELSLLNTNVLQVGLQTAENQKQTALMNAQIRNSLTPLLMNLIEVVEDEVKTQSRLTGSTIRRVASTSELLTPYNVIDDRNGHLVKRSLEREVLFAFLTTNNFIHAEDLIELLEICNFGNVHVENGVYTSLGFLDESSVHNIHKKLLSKPEGLPVKLNVPNSAFHSLAFDDCFIEFETGKTHLMEDARMIGSALIFDGFEIKLSNAEIENTKLFVTSNTYQIDYTSFFTWDFINDRNFVHFGGDTESNSRLSRAFIANTDLILSGQSLISETVFVDSHICVHANTGTIVFKNCYFGVDCDFDQLFVEVLTRDEFGSLTLLKPDIGKPRFLFDECIIHKSHFSELKMLKWLELEKYQVSQISKEQIEDVFRKVPKPKGWLGGGIVDLSSPTRQLRAEEALAAYKASANYRLVTTTRHDDSVD